MGRVIGLILPLFFGIASAQANPAPLRISDLAVRFDLEAGSVPPGPRVNVVKPVVGRCGGKELTDMAALEGCQSHYAVYQAQFADRELMKTIMREAGR